MGADDMNENTLVFSIAETAKALGVSERHIARLLASGALPSVRIGRRRLVRRAALKGWLEGWEAA